MPNIHTNGHTEAKKPREELHYQQVYPKLDIYKQFKCVHKGLPKNGGNVTIKSIKPPEDLYKYRPADEVADQDEAQRRAALGVSHPTSSAWPKA